MKRVRLFLTLSIMVISAIAFIGCSKKEEKGTLNLFMWTEYIPDSVIEGFEEETGIDVQMQTYSSNEEMLAKVQGSNPGAYDIVCPSDYMVENMISQDLLLEMDNSKIGNIGNLDPAYLYPSYDPESKYSVPYMGGAGVIIYNKNMVEEGDDFSNYEDLFNPYYKNSIVVLDDLRSIIGITALSMGYSFNEVDEAKLDEIKAKMLELKPNIKSLDSDSPKTLMITEETAIGLIWSGEAALAIEENEDLDVAFPEEGMYLFLDNLCITKASKNTENAYKFIEYVLKPEVNKEISTEFPYLNPNLEGVALMGEDYKNNKAIAIPAQEIKKGFYVQNIGKTVDLYSEIWAEFTK